MFIGSVEHLEAERKPEEQFTGERCAKSTEFCR